MTLPIVTPNYFQERAGVIQVALKLNELNLVFRETPNADVGIDGQVEYVNNVGETTGKIIAVQIKSGQSYLNDRGNHWAYYPSEKHKNYWQSFPIPVYLFIHDPSNDNIYFENVRHFLSTPENVNSKYIPVSKSTILNQNSKGTLFESTGASDEDYLNNEELIKYLISRKNNNADFPISFFELFVHGLTNLCRQYYFSISVAYEIAEINIEFEKSEFGIIGLGFEEHEFLHEFVKFILKQNLVKVDYGDYLIDWKERLLQPTFIAPLTLRGQLLLLEIRKWENLLFTNELTQVSVASERSLQMIYLPSDYIRNRKIFDFQKKYIIK